MYSIHNVRKSVAAERFIRIWKDKVYKYVTSISKNIYIDKLDDIVNKYNNRYHRYLRYHRYHVDVNPVDVNPSMYIDFNKGNNKERPKFKVVDYVRIPKYQNIFAKS